MMKATDIIAKYTSGEKTLDETNVALKEIHAGFHLNPEKNTIAPDEVGRYGLLDTGTATFDKVEVMDGELVNCDLHGMYALCLFGGKTYRVEGKKLVEV